jgi:hypothetical protein
MKSAPSVATPVAAICPLCGQPNACASVQGGNADQPCWCVNTTFSAELLARVPDNLRDVACICQACVAKHNAVKP